MNKKIKIAFVIPSLLSGGAERVVANIVNSLDKNKFEVVLIIIQNKPISYSIDSSIKIIQLNKSRVSSSIIKLLFIVKKESPDILFSTLSYLNTIIGLISPLFSKDSKLIARESTIPSENHARYNSYKSYFYNFLLSKAYRFFDKIVCQSDAMINDLQQNFNVNGKKLIKIVNPVQIDNIIKKSNEEFNLISNEKNTIIFVSVGMLRPEKGFKRVIRTMSYLNVDFIYYIIGEGIERNAIQNEIEKYNLKGKIKLIGFSSNPFSLIKKSNIFLQTSFMEGMPNAVIEAGVLGIPTVAFDCIGGTKEVIEEGLNGYTSNIINDNDFLIAINKILNGDIGSKQDIKDYVGQKFSSINIIKEYENLFIETSKIKK